MSLTQDKSDLFFVFSFFLFSLSSYLLSCVCVAGHLAVFTELLFVTVAGGRAACLAGGRVCGGTLARERTVGGVSGGVGGWGWRRREQEWEVRVHGWVAAQPQPGAASPSLLMVSGASQDQWLREGGFCWPHFVQDEIHIYPPPHEDR